MKISRRDMLKGSGLAVGGLALSGGSAMAANPTTPQAVPRMSLEKRPEPGQMRISFFGTWYTPRPNQACNSIFVELGNYDPNGDPTDPNNQGDSFVFDCGAGVVSRYVAMGVPYSRMDRVFLTHLHGDHMSDLVTIYCFGPSSDRKTPLHVYGPSGDTKNEGTWFFCKSLYEMCKWHRESFSFLPTGVLGDGDGYDLLAHELPYMKNPGVAYAATGRDGKQVHISHFPVVHARNGAVGYKVEYNGHSMVFTGDTKPNTYVVKHAQEVDVLIHEMTTYPDVWTYKQTGLKSGPQFDYLEGLNAEVVENSHTLQPALGYILNQTNPKLGVATHFPNDPDLVDSAMSDIRCFYPQVSPDNFVIAQDWLVITIDASGTIRQAVADVPEYPWYTGQAFTRTLTDPKYDGPLAQFNATLLEHVIPEADYDKCMNDPGPGPY